MGVAKISARHNHFSARSGSGRPQFLRWGSRTARKAYPQSGQTSGLDLVRYGVPGVELHCVPDKQLVPPDTRHHFCLEVDDLARQRKLLIEAGTKIIDARALPLRPRFFARDPFNNLIEFVQIEGDYLAAGE